MGASSERLNSSTPKLINKKTFRHDDDDNDDDEHPTSHKTQPATAPLGGELLQRQCNWDRGWLQHRAQEEAVKLWAREGDQWLRMVG